MMRIITGTAKGKKLVSLEGDATRPTSERIKEAVFSSIQFDVEGRRVLDLFAGSGQMGLESLSRGAQKATFIDLSREAMDIVKQNARITGFFDVCHFLVSDWRNYIRKASGREQYDLVFIDPPYALRVAGEAVKALLDSDMLKPTSIIVVESEESDIFENMPETKKKFTVLKETKYGVAHITVLTRREEE